MRWTAESFTDCKTINSKIAVRVDSTVSVPTNHFDESFRDFGIVLRLTKDERVWVNDFDDTSIWIYYELEVGNRNSCEVKTNI